MAELAKIRLVLLLKIKLGVLNLGCNLIEMGCLTARLEVRLVDIKLLVLSSLVMGLEGLIVFSSYLLELEFGLIVWPILVLVCIGRPIGWSVDLLFNIVI